MFKESFSVCFFQEYLNDYSRKFQGPFLASFKELSRGCQGCFKGVSWHFQGCFQSVLRVFPEGF